MKRQPVDLTTLTPTETRFAQMMIDRLHGGGAMIAGTYCEVVVAEALQSAKISTLGTHYWDLDWRNFRIEVKATSSTKWAVPKTVARLPDDRRADVYILGRYDATDPDWNWSFHAVPTSFLEGVRTRKDRPTKSVTLATVETEYPAVTADGLRTAVRKAFNAERKFG